VVTRSVLAPINAVLLTRRHIEEVVEDAVKRGRMTRDDAQQILQNLLQRGAKQTDDFLADLERLFGRGRDMQAQAAGTQARGSRARRSRGSGSSLPIRDYDDLSAAAVQERLGGLTPAELRKLRDYERRHANRKTVLDPIDKRLR
jgi:polyhydroxyalkanoate synthesis regulator phasin